MSTSHRSIGYYLNKKGKSDEDKKILVEDWVKNWEQEQYQMISMLERSIKNDDYDLLCRVTGQLKAVTEKKFTALRGIADKIDTFKIKED